MGPRPAILARDKDANRRLSPVLDAAHGIESIVDEVPMASVATHDADGRPTKPLPLAHLIRISMYWLGISAVWSGILDIVNNRLQYTGLVPKGSEGLGGLQIALAGTFIAILVQPTVGTISDYTMTRWGRRKPYIFIGAALDLVFLWGVATSNTLPAVAAFVTMLQFSSNFAQGPFQGYVPDLVPAKQVGLASGLIGLMAALGNVAGYAVSAVALVLSQTDPNAFVYGTMAIGLIEFLTMLSVVLHVDEGKTVKPRAGKSWFAIAREAWGTDILRERSFLWLVGSRFCILTGAALYPIMATFYLAQVFGLDQRAAGDTKLVLGNRRPLRHPIGCPIEPAVRQDRPQEGDLRVVPGRRCGAWNGCRRAGPVRGPGRSSPIRGRCGGLFGRGLGAHERHRSQGLDGPLHGHLQRGHGFGRHGGPGARGGRRHGHREPRLRLRDRPPSRARPRCRVLHPGRAAAQARS